MLHERLHLLPQSPDFLLLSILVFTLIYYNIPLLSVSIPIPISVRNSIDNKLKNRWPEIINCHSEVYHCCRVAVSHRLCVALISELVLLLDSFENVIVRVLVQTGSFNVLEGIVVGKALLEVAMFGCLGAVGI